MSLSELIYLSENIKENNIQNLEALSFCNPNDFLDIFAFRNHSNTSIDAIQETVQENLNKNRNLQIAFNEIIKNILRENGIKKEIFDKFDENYITEKEKKNVLLFKSEQTKNKNSGNNKEQINLGKKRRRKNKNENTDMLEKTNLGKKREIGRKKKDDITKGNHTKYAPDNIIKKCKRIFFKYIITYINLIIKKYMKENFEFKNLSYKKYINNLKKENEKLLLEKPLKDFVSLDISCKYDLNEDFNRQKMEKILKDEKDNQELISSLNMTFGEWIDVFTFKKKIDSDIEFHGLKEVLEDLYNKVDKEYFSRLIFYLLNYKNWFRNIKPIKSKRNN